MKRKRNYLKLKGLILLSVLILTIWFPVFSVSSKSIQRNEYKSYFINMAEEYNEITKLIKVSILLMKSEFDSIYSAKNYYLKLLNEEVSKK